MWSGRFRGHTTLLRRNTFRQCLDRFPSRRRRDSTQKVSLFYNRRHWLARVGSSQYLEGRMYPGHSPRQSGQDYGLTTLPTPYSLLPAISCPSSTVRRAEPHPVLPFLSRLCHVVLLGARDVPRDSDHGVLSAVGEEEHARFKFAEAAISPVSRGVQGDVRSPCTTTVIAEHEA